LILVNMSATTHEANSELTSNTEVDYTYFQPSDAMWCHTFHLSLICMILPSDFSSHRSTLH
jgi:hypothetical protein